MKDAATGKPVHLPDILRGCGGMVRALKGSPSKAVSSVEYNSARVTGGSLFVAVEGFQSDGHGYVHDAVRRGAAAVVVSAARAAEFSSPGEDGVTVLVAENTRKALSRLAACFYGFPASRVPVVGVTGTNGKTSITYMLESVFRAHGWSPAVIGTVNYRWKGKDVPAPNTTPESKDLQEIIARMVDDGADALIMEVSSHGLKLNRVDDVEFSVGVFTNLTRDHLDFHATFEDYFESKRRLFELMDAGSRKGKTGIVNCDDPFGRRILSGKGSFSYPLLGFGAAADADYMPDVSSISNTIEGVGYRLEKPLSGVDIRLRLSGAFNVPNSLCAFAAAHVMGVPVETIRRGLFDLGAVPGRFDRISSPEGFHVIVDYAHTDDALAKLLASVRELAPRRVITVFGCGGNRDKTKRPIMGESASRLSDRVIVTSDTPRNEDPGVIIRDICAGITGTNFEVEPDREEAIRKAVYMAGEGDMLVVAGKGHEDYQIIGKERRHFDDREVVRKYMEERERR
jgi:UDP-N-acetylmuramoyl-L-alanyl-D-glutamate--2,6-diaminopimelate ligase